MMKRLVACVLILLMSSPYVTRLLSYSSFKANQAYIAVALCGNKAKPEMKCLGLCYFEKQMQKQQGAEKALSAPIQKKQEEPAIISSVPCFYPLAKVVPLVNFSQVPLHLSSYLGDVFHPPQV